MKKSKVYGLWSVVCCLLSVVCILSYGAALTADKPVSSRPGEYAVLSVDSNTVIYAGSLVAVDSNGYGVPASDTAALKVIGVANAAIDQRAGLYDSTKTLVVRRGVFLFKNGGSLTDANIGDWAYVEDDQTVSTAAEMTNDILAGVIIDVDSSGVWVDVGAVNRAGALAGTTLNASGNAAVGGTLAVTGATTLTGALAANGGVNCDSGKFTVADTSGNTAIAGTLNVTGTTTASNVVASGSVTFSGLPTATNGLSAGALWNSSGTIKIME